MAQQYPPNGGRGAYGGRNSSQGRGPGRGGGIPPQQQAQAQPYNYPAGGSGRGGPRPVAAWQQTQQPQPSSLQQAVTYGASQPPQQGQPRQMPTTAYPPMAPIPYYQPYTGAGASHPGQWPGQAPYVPSPLQQNAMRGGMYYPPGAPPVVNTITPVPIPQSQIQQPVAPREKKPLVITDKQGNVITFGSSTKSPSSATPQTVSTTAPKPITPDAGAKLREAALERLKGQSGNKSDKKTAEIESESKVKSDTSEKSQIDAESKARLEAEEKALLEAEEKARLEAEEKITEENAKLEAEEKARLEAEEKAKLEAEEKVKIEAEEKAKLESEEKSKADAEARRIEAEEKSEEEAKNTPPPPKRIVITKDDFLRFKNEPQCVIRPSRLPDMTIVRQAANNKPISGGGGGGGSGGGGGGGDRRNRGGNRGDVGGGGGGNWERGNAPPRRQSSQGERNDRGGGGGGGGGGEWSRGQAPPRQQSQSQKGRGGRGGRGGHHNQIMFDGPVAPLVKSENHWRPRKNTSALVVAEKRVKSLLNKMTKEKFDRLAEQMLEIPISSYEILTMMIDSVYDKAIDEPRFGDMYADLCVRLSQSVQGTEFVHIIESDEEPPTEDGSSAPVAGESSSHTVYRWSNDISTMDSEIVGPLPSPDACIDAALDEEERTPIERGEMELELVSVVIKRSIFIKTMKKKNEGDDEEDAFYAVYFPTSEAEECGQFLSGIFLSQLECESDAAKKNSFKRSLLNKCEEEFNKQDIYVDWKKEKKEYEESKSKFSETERREKEEELNFRRIRIKKQMLGNVQFIGQLYKKNLLKEKIMRYCIASLLKLDENKSIKAKNPEYTDSGVIDTIDEEDHEAICSLFTTIGATIDKPPAADFMRLCFQKIGKLSVDIALPSRSRFMYKDLIELRSNTWVPRRKEEKAKTIAEIRKEVEQEERRQAEESARAGRGGGGGDFRASGRGAGDTRSGGSSRFLQQQQTNARARQSKPTSQTDDDGFTQVVGPKAGVLRGSSHGSVRPRISPSAPTMNRHTTYDALDDEKESPSQSASAPAPLSEDVLKRKVKSMRMDFITGGGNVGDLLLNFTELTGTPEHGSLLISTSLDTLFESKEEERKAIVRIIVILCEKGKLTKDDAQSGLADAVEFIDDIAVDSPRAFNYLGDLLGEMLAIKAIDIIWLCDQLEKIKANNDETRAPEEILRYSLLSLKQSGSPDIHKSSQVEKRIVSLLGADKWQTILKAL